MIISTFIPAQCQFGFNSHDTLNIFLLRGLTRESGHWGAEFLGAVSAAFPNSKISQLDLPGSGKYYQEKSGTSVNKLMEFMRERELTNIQATRGKNLILASSLGALVAAEWAEKHPEDFQGIVLAAGSFKKICDLDERANPKIRKELIRVFFEKDLATREAMVLNINSNDEANFDKNLSSWIEMQESRPMTKANMFRQSIAGMRYAFSGNVPQVPVLIIGSRGDRLVSETCTTKVHEAFGGEIAWHETAGHGIPIDAPHWMVSKVQTWVNGPADYEWSALAESK